MQRAPLLRWLVFGAAIVTWPVGDAHAGRLQVVAVNGDPAPGGGVYELSGLPPALNNAGMVAFTGIRRREGNPNGPTWRQAYRFDSGDSSTALLNETRVFGHGGASIAADGRVAVLGSVVEGQSGVLATDGTNLKSLAMTGDVLTDGSGFTLDSILRFVVGPRINTAGQTAFRGFISQDGDPPIEAEAILLADGDSLIAVARTGTPTPGRVGELGAFRVTPALNDAGQVAFSALIHGTSGQGATERGVFRADKSGLTTIFRSGQESPVGTLLFSPGTFVREPVMNEAGQVAVVTEVRGATIGQGVFVGDGETTRLIALTSSASPDGDGSFASFRDDSVSLNDAGQVGFQAVLSESDSRSGLYRGDGDELLTVARVGDPLPDGDGVFLAFASPTALNEAGQMVFSARIFDGRHDEGIYVYDDQRGMTEVIRTGAPLLGSSIVDLRFHDDVRGGFVHGGTDENSGFNARGQVAFGFGLEDGRHGVALWTVPEPHAASLLAFACWGLLADGRRDRFAAG